MLSPQGPLGVSPDPHREDFEAFGPWIVEAALPSSHHEPHSLSSWSLRTLFVQHISIFYARGVRGLYAPKAGGCPSLDPSEARSARLPTVPPPAPAFPLPLQVVPEP